MIRNGLIILVFSTTFFACKNEKQVETEKVDSVETAQAIQHEDSASIFDREVKGWLDSTVGKSSGNIEKKITLEEYWQEQNLEKRPFDPENNFYKNYKPLLRWSPDSTYILDIGTYGMIPVQNNNGTVTLEAGEPDTELALINVPGNERTRLMFVGPSSRIIDAKWIGNREAVVIGTFDRGGIDQTDTLLWMINVDNSYFRLYNIKSTNK